ncbi:unnamed protein product, partial [Sphacelaria rigidula]
RRPEPKAICGSPQEPPGKTPGEPPEGAARVGASPEGPRRGGNLTFSSQNTFQNQSKMGIVRGETYSQRFDARKKEHLEDNLNKARDIVRQWTKLSPDTEQKKTP